MEHYFTISPKTYTWEQVIKKSRFILNVARVTSEEEARLFIAKINKQHYKASHNVFAYMLGDQDQIQRFSDNGEPNGTAGVPMLEALQKNQIHDVVAVVTRYFGGVKLGAGGLIRAYASTTADGLKAAGFVERLALHQVTITIAYKHVDSLTYWLTQNDYHIMTTNYDENVHLIVPVSEVGLPSFQNTLTNQFAGNIGFDIGDITFFEIPVK